MAQLMHQLREVTCPDGSPATVVALNGSIDPASIDDFDSIFDDLLSQGTKRIIMDLEKLKYINSTGMGIMVQYCDQLAEDGGGLVLMCVQPKITLVLEMLGLQEFFPIVATEKEALAALMGENVAPANVQVQLSDAEPVSVSESTGKVSCGGCGADLIIPGPGNYVCPRCRAILEADDAGRVSTRSSQSNANLELCIPAEMPFYKSAAALVARVGLRAGLSDANARAVADAFLNALQILFNACYGASQTLVNNNSFNIMACADNGDFRVHIYAGGAKVTDSGIFSPCNVGFDRIDFEAVNGGNLLSLGKKVS